MEERLHEREIDLKIYFIPKNVKTRFEFFDGYGLREAGITLIFTLCGLALGFILWLFFGRDILLFLFLPAGALGFFLSKPDPRTGKSALMLIRDVRDFNSKQKRYFYRFGSGR